MGKFKISSFEQKERKEKGKIIISYLLLYNAIRNGMNRKFRV